MIDQQHLFSPEMTHNVYGGLIKKYVLNHIKICQFGAILRSSFCHLSHKGVLNKDSTVWLDGAGPAPMYGIAWLDNIFGWLADLIVSKIMLTLNQN